MSDTYRLRTPETWDQARQDYLAGQTAETVCARYDLGLSAFHKRARADGWRRVDQPDPEPLDDDATDLPDADPAALADLALRRMGAAVRRGRASEALRWQRLHATLTEGMARQAEAERRALAAAEAEAGALRAAQAQARAVARRDARIAALLPPGATAYDRTMAMLDDMIAHGTALDEGQEVQEVHDDSDLPPSDPAPDAAQDRETPVERS